MATIKKKDIDLDTTVIKLKLILKGRRDILYIDCTATQAIEFIDYINDNRAVVRNKKDKEKMENRYYIFDDILNKKNIVVSLQDIRYMEIPDFQDVGEEYDLKILTIN